MHFFLDFYGLLWIVHSKNHPCLDLPIGMGSGVGPADQVHLQKEQLEKVSALGKQRFPKLTPGRGIGMNRLAVCFPRFISRYPAILQKWHPVIVVLDGNTHGPQQLKLAAVAASPDWRIDSMNRLYMLHVQSESLALSNCMFGCLSQGTTFDTLSQHKSTRWGMSAEATGCDVSPRLASDLEL